MSPSRFRRRPMALPVVLAVIFAAGVASFGATTLVGRAVVHERSAIAQPARVGDHARAFCASIVAYVRRHAEPHFAIECPVDLPRGGVAGTCVPAIDPATCKRPVIFLSTRACMTAAENEASNSWVLWAYARSGHIPARVRQGGVPDYPGQYGIDNYGEC